MCHNYPATPLMSTDRHCLAHIHGAHEGVASYRASASVKQFFLPRPLPPGCVAQMRSSMEEDEQLAVSAA